MLPTCRVTICGGFLIGLVIGIEKQIHHFFQELRRYSIISSYKNTDDPLLIGRNGFEKNPFFER